MSDFSRFIDGRCSIRAYAAKGDKRNELYYLELLTSLDYARTSNSLLRNLNYLLFMNGQQIIQAFYVSGFRNYD